jgi:hypothetical protein
MILIILYSKTIDWRDDTWLAWPRNPRISDYLNHAAADEDVRRQGDGTF